MESRCIHNIPTYETCMKCEELDQKHSSDADSTNIAIDRIAFSLNQSNIQSAESSLRQVYDLTHRTKALKEEHKSEEGNIEQVEDEKEEKFNVELRKSMIFLLDNVHFGAAHDLFNTDYWQKHKNIAEALDIIEGKSPSEAIKQLYTYATKIQDYEGMETAKLDCVEVIEVGRWLAELAVINEMEFDAKYALSLCLNAPGSTGIETRYLAIREGTNGDDWYSSSGSIFNGMFKYIKGKSNNQYILLQKLLNEIPIGSRVMFRNFDKYVPDDHDFKNENTIKIGLDEFAAHPFGIMSLQEVVTQIAKGGYEDMMEAIKDEEEEDDEEEDDEEENDYPKQYYKNITSQEAYAQKFVRIVEIEVFELPF